jgi:hypothetical protein
VVAWRIRQILAYAKVSFGRKNGRMAQAQLNLVESSIAFMGQLSEFMGQLSEGAPEIMASELRDADLLAVVLHHLHDVLFQQSFPGDLTSVIQCRKTWPVCNPAASAHTSR